MQRYGNLCESGKLQPVYRLLRALFLATKILRDFMIARHVYTLRAACVATKLRDKLCSVIAPYIGP